MAETWYRGQSSTVNPSRPGGDIHDFGDGLYLSSLKAVGEQYADMRVSVGGGERQVLKIEINRTELGRVLDLNADPRWKRFLKEPLIPGMPDRTPERLIKLANENYGRLFEQFVKQNNIRIQDYDTVIGPEFVRGGSQLCILHRNGKPSPLAIRIKAQLQPVEPDFPGGGPEIPEISGRGLVEEEGSAKDILGNQAAMWLLCQWLGEAIQYVGDLGIQRQVQKKLATTHAKAIRDLVSRGYGVLVIIAMQEWEQPDDNGMRVRMLLDVYIQGGVTQAAALNIWQSTPRLFAGPAEGWRRFEQYVWIRPSR